MILSVLIVERKEKEADGRASFTYLERGEAGSTVFSVSRCIVFTTLFAWWMMSFAIRLSC